MTEAVERFHALTGEVRPLERTLQHDWRSTSAEKPKKHCDQTTQRHEKSKLVRQKIETLATWLRQKIET